MALKVTCFVSKVIFKTSANYVAQNHWSAQDTKRSETNRPLEPHGTEPPTNRTDTNRPEVPVWLCEPTRTQTNRGIPVKDTERNCHEVSHRAVQSLQGKGWALWSPGSAMHQAVQLDKPAQQPATNTTLIKDDGSIASIALSIWYSVISADKVPIFASLQPHESTLKNSRLQLSSQSFVQGAQCFTKGSVHRLHGGHQGSIADFAGWFVKNQGQQQLAIDSLRSVALSRWIVWNCSFKGSADKQEDAIGLRSATYDSLQLTIKFLLDIQTCPRHQQRELQHNIVRFPGQRSNMVKRITSFRLRRGLLQFQHSQTLQPAVPRPRCFHWGLECHSITHLYQYSAIV